MAREVVIHGTSAQALLLLPLLIPLVLLLTGRRRGQRGSQQERRHLPPLPPSPPRKLPVFGHLHLVDPLPHVSFRDITEKHGREGLMLLRLGVVPTLVASSPSAAEAVLRTHDHALASRPSSAVVHIIFYGSSDVAFAAYGEHWRQARKSVTTHMLSARKVHSFRHDREDEVRVAMAKIRESVAAAAAAAAPATAVDMSELQASFANDVVCRVVLGRRHRDEGRNKLLRELIDINMSLLGGFNVEDYFPSLAMADVLTKVVCARAKKVRKRWDDLLDRLIEEHQRVCHGGELQEESADFIQCYSLGRKSTASQGTKSRPTCWTCLKRAQKRHRVHHG